MNPKNNGDISGLNDAAARFAQILLERHPEWRERMSAYKADGQEASSGAADLWLEIPSPKSGGPPLWLSSNGLEATIGLGYKSAEQLYIWTAAELKEASGEVLQFIEDVLAGRIVVGWEAHGFLWLKWHSKGFYPATEISSRRNVDRIDRWPAQ